MSGEIRSAIEHADDQYSFNRKRIEVGNGLSVW